MPWDISLRGGMWKLVADFRELRLTRLEVTGGASDIEVFLPRLPASSRFDLRAGPAKSWSTAHAAPRPAPRSAAAPAQLVFDGQRLGAVGGTDCPVVRGFADAADRYEIRFAGGASHVTVTTD